MTLRIYNFLVNRKPGIRDRYHQFHDSAAGIRRFISWLYLLALNFGYYVLQLQYLGSKREIAMYEEKKLLTDLSESKEAVSQLPTVQEYIDKLSQYDVISFDIFDTLIFRPFSDPTDLFFFVGERLSFMDFKRIRMEMEHKARQKCYATKGHYEVTLADIWALMEEETGIDAQQGMEIERELEKQFCYANPFMKQVYDALRAKGKTVILVSDMYLPSACLKEILQKQGLVGYKKLYISGEYGLNKASGSLYLKVSADMENVCVSFKKCSKTGSKSAGNNNQANFNYSIIHVGDNPHSDCDMARKAGWDTMPYRNINKNMSNYRAYDMSTIIGGAYRGLVQNHIWNGEKAYSMEYEYGYIYGGLFAVGYCRFIHDYVHTHGMDKILFLARDGDILNQVYNRMYPEDNTAYVYWSRRAATKLMAVRDKYDYFRRFVYHKVNQGYTLGNVLESMELDSSLINNELLKEMLIDKNAPHLITVLQKHWSEVLAKYEPEHRAAKQYYAGILKDCEKTAAVDIGWAGSGAMALRYLVEQYWQLPCEVYGIVAGTNTVHNTEPDASESFLQSGKMAAYLFSQTQNRDLLKKHDLNKDFNVYWELLLASPTRQFLGFDLTEEGDTRFNFGKYDSNLNGIRQVQQGILDFTEDYLKHFGKFTYMLQISGRDAYAPMLLAAGRDEAYLKRIKKLFSLEVQVE